MAAALAVETWNRPDYFAPVTCALYLVLVQGMRNIWHWSPAGRPLGKDLVRAIPVLACAMIVLRLTAVALHVPIEPAWPRGNLERAMIVGQLQRLPRGSLEIVYSARHNLHEEWVYNAADIDAAKVVWARDMGIETNQELLSYFKDRQSLASKCRRLATPFGILRGSRSMRPRLWLLLALCAAGISWLYVHRILGPWSSRTRLAGGYVIAQISDLYSPWVGTQELLLHRRNPYGTEVSHEIQMAFYGHVINQNYEGPKAKLADEQRFAYPVYEVFLMAPLAYAHFGAVQRWAPLVLGSLVARNIFFCLSILPWKAPWETVAAIVLLTLSSPQIVQGMRLQQLAIVDGCLLIAAAWCVSRNHLAAAGLFLAVSTIKPQMALLPLCWFAVWATGDWARKMATPGRFHRDVDDVVCRRRTASSGMDRILSLGTRSLSKIRTSYVPTSNGSR